MPYKLDGAKFPTLEDLVEALYPLYADKMSEEEFKKYAEGKRRKELRQSCCNRSFSRNVWRL